MILLGILFSILLIIFYVIDYLAPVLFIVFLILKLCNVIAWLLVFTPLIAFGVSLVLTITFTFITSLLD